VKVMVNGPVNIIWINIVRREKQDYWFYYFLFLKMFFTLPMQPCIYNNEVDISQTTISLGGKVESAGGQYSYMYVIMGNSRIN
jgi:hypothetical protein